MPIRTFHHSAFPPERIAAGRSQTVTVVVPAKQCATTITGVARPLVALREAGAIDQVLVVDADSPDGTAALAADAGAEVVSERALMPEFGPVLGKGDAMWRALSACRGEIVCFVDGDSGHFGPHFACGLLGPLLLEPEIAYVKGFFRRPFRTGEGVSDEGGGRVTELTARPLIRRFWPELAGLHQPLAGEMAAARTLFESLPWATGYAVETALLLDISEQVGPNRIAQVDLEVRQNDHQRLAELGSMADEVLAAATVRLERDGRLDGGPVELVERPPMRSVRAAAA